MSNPVSARATAQRLDQHRLHSIFTFLTLTDLAAVSGSCRLWCSDVLSLKCRRLRLKFTRIDRGIFDRLQNLVLAPVCLHLSHIVLEATESATTIRLLGSIHLLHYLPALEKMDLAFRASTKVMEMMRAIRQGSTTASFFPPSLLQLKISMNARDGTTARMPLMQLLIDATAQLTYLHTLTLADGGDAKATYSPSLRFPSFLQLAPSLTDLTLALLLSNSAARSLCSVLKQIPGLKSVQITTVFFLDADVVSALFTPPHALQQLQRLSCDCLQLNGTHLPLLTSIDVPSLKYISAWHLYIASVDEVTMLLDQSWSLDVPHLQLELNNTQLPEEQADALLARLPRLKELQLRGSFLSSLHCLRFVPELNRLTLFQSSRHLRAEDIEHVYPLSQLKYLIINESAPVLLTTEVMATLKVPSHQMPSLVHTSLTLLLNPAA